MELVCTISGSLIILVAACDVFLTVLYARSGISLLSTPINKGLWLVFHHAARFFRGRKDVILSFCGPLLMIVILTVWGALMIFGFALIVWPELGDGVAASHGGTDPGFWNAFFYSGYTFTTLGIGNLTPRTDLFRLLSVLESAMGFTFFTMTITYFLSVFNALHRRNTFALALHHKTRATADAAVYLDGLWRRPHEFRREFSDVAAALSDLQESHHLYPILHYFRFREDRYALPRILTICLDTASMARSIGRNPCRRFEASAAAEHLWISAMDLLTTMTPVFLPGRFQGHLDSETPAEDALFERRFRLALERTARCPLHGESAALPEAAERYARLRRQWQSHVMAFCHSQVYEREAIMPYEQETRSLPAGDRND